MTMKRQPYLQSEDRGAWASEACLWFLDLFYTTN